MNIGLQITKNEKNLLLKYTENQLVYGGKTRFASLKQALKNINSNNYDFLMIHDAARPTFTKNIMIELLSSMNSKKYHCAVPASKVEDICSKGNKILFVGTKRSASKTIREEASNIGLPYVDKRWLGGTLTNWKTIRGSIRRLSLIHI